MGNIKVNITGVAITGKVVTFTAPCDCDKVTDGIVINGTTYTICDAMGNKVTGTGGVWCSGAQISVVLDCENKKAYLQNGKSTPAMIGAAKAEEHAVKSYSTLGLKDSDYLDENGELLDAKSCFGKIHDAMTAPSEFRAYISSSSNLAKAIKAQLELDLGFTLSTYYNLRVIRMNNQSKIIVLPAYYTSSDPKKCTTEYTAILRWSVDIQYMSPFSVSVDPNGFVSKAGDTMTGGLNVASGTGSRSRFFGYTGRTHIRNEVDSNTYQDIMFDGNYFRFTGKNAGANFSHDILHTGNINSLYPTAKVVTGSYIGTNKGQVDIVFPSVPKAVFIAGDYSEAVGTETHTYGKKVLWFAGSTIGLTFNAQTSGTVSVGFSGTTMQLRDTNGENINKNGVTYTYTAIL